MLTGVPDPLRFVALDFEATGVDPERDRVVQVGVVEFDFAPGAARARWASLVDPQRPIPRESTAVHGIGDCDVVGAPVAAAVIPSLLDRLRGRYVVTYNGFGYDYPLLRAECERAGIRFDPRAFAPIDVYPYVPAGQGWGGKRLLAQAARYGIQIEAHEAASDAEAAGWLLLVLIMRGLAPATLPECFAAQAGLHRDLLRPRQVTMFPEDNP